MLDRSDVIAFASATDLRQARAFYEQVLGPGGDRVAWFTDPDGSVLSLTQFG